MMDRGRVWPHQYITREEREGGSLRVRKRSEEGQGAEEGGDEGGRTSGGRKVP